MGLASIDPIYLVLVACGPFGFGFTAVGPLRQWAFGEVWASALAYFAHVGCRIVTSNIKSVTFAVPKAHRSRMAGRSVVNSLTGGLSHCDCAGFAGEPRYEVHKFVMMGGA